jgi:hypothetical protein
MRLRDAMVAPQQPSPAPGQGQGSPGGLGLPPRLAAGLMALRAEEGAEGEGGRGRGPDEGPRLKLGSARCGRAGVRAGAVRVRALALHLRDAPPPCASSPALPASQHAVAARGLAQRPGVGHAVRCDALGCRVTGFSRAYTVGPNRRFRYREVDVWWGGTDRGRGRLGRWVPPWRFARARAPCGPLAGTAGPAQQGAVPVPLLSRLPAATSATARASRTC